jgi:hypothetical protein
MTLTENRFANNRLDSNLQTAPRQVKYDPAEVTITFTCRYIYIFIFLNLHLYLNINEITYINIDAV